MYLKTATAEATDLGSGQFSAIAASYSTDRTRERIIPGAFQATIKRWRRAGRDVPLAWDHGRDARDIIGSIDSNSMEERAEGLYVEGQLDIEDSEVAREAWRSVRKGRISLSFGYMVEDSRTGADGVRELTRLDLAEVTITSVPANADTRVLSAKSAATTDQLLDGSREFAAATLAEFEAELEAETLERSRALVQETLRELGEEPTPKVEEERRPLPPPPGERKVLVFNGFTFDAIYEGDPRFEAAVEARRASDRRAAEEERRREQAMRARHEQLRRHPPKPTISVLGQQVHRLTINGAVVFPKD